LKGYNFNNIRRVKQKLPFLDKSLLKKIFHDIASKYNNRPGGYTRIFRLGIRFSDTSKMAKLEWV